MRKLQHTVTVHAKTIVAAFAVAGVAAGWAATGIRIDGSVDGLLLSSDPARALDNRAKREFGNDEIIMVGFDLGRPYTADDLRKLEQISERIAGLDNVRRVRDMATTEDVRDSDGFLDASPLIDFDTLEAELPAIRARAEDHQLYAGRLLSSDGHVFGLAVYADSEKSNDAELNRLTAEVIAVVDALAPPWEVHFAGYPVTAFEVNRIMRRDLALLTPVALVGIALVLAFVTRRAFPLALLLALVVWVELAALAWLALSRTALNVVLSSLPTILIATTGTYVVYTLGLLRRVSRDPVPAKGLVALLLRPVLLSAGSTAIGFASLALIDVRSAGELGAALAVGCVAAGVGTLLLLPALVHLFDLRLPEAPGRRFDPSPLLSRVAQRGVRLSTHPWHVLGCTGLLLGLAVPGLLRLTVHTDTLQYFAEDNRIRGGAEFFRERLSSGFLLNVVLRGEEPGRVLDPDVLDFADRLERDLAANPKVDRTISMLDYFELIDAAVRAEPPAQRNPGSRAAATQYLLLYESGGDPDDFERYINFDRSALSLLVSIHGGSRVYLTAAERVEALAEGAPEGLAVDVLGTTFLYSKAMEELTWGMVKGLAVASLLITGVLAIGLGSLRLGLIATVPNVLPIVVFGGTLGWLGVPISMSTSLVGCIVLGLAVDDTAHVMGHLGRERSLERLYGIVGPPLLLTTLALGLGFSALMLSEFAFITNLGAAVVATLVLAILADLVMLPALLVVTGCATVRGDEASPAPTRLASPGAAGVFSGRHGAGSARPLPPAPQRPTSTPATSARRSPGIAASQRPRA
ncbi:MAG: MMPL family transporter [Myxococcota bacterium]|nr:MMPL family transporter [Myxococcota bacterium]